MANKKKKQVKTAMSNIPQQGVKEMINNRQPMTKTEKKVFSIIFGVAGLAIVLIIIFNLITFAPSTSKSAIAKEYPSLGDAAHVFEYITVEKVKEKIAAKETFHLYYGSPDVQICDEYVGAANTLAKDEYDISVIYYINASRITTDELADLAKALEKPNGNSLSTSDLSIPTFSYIYFDEETNPDNSLVYYARSNLLNLEDFDDSANDLLVSYFNTVFQE
ncbi:MAG: hypothetical protein PHT83_04215 [Bacilli bacterium]|nr:hypothetical protein [Bacilli bacterium]